MNIRDNGTSGIEFDMYLQSSDNMVLNQQALLEAVVVSLYRHTYSN